MKHRVRDLLACPECGTHPLELTVIETETGPPPAVVPRPPCQLFCSFKNERIATAEAVARPCGECYRLEMRTGILHCTGCGREYPVIDGIPRFVPDVYDDFPDFPKKHAACFRQPPREASVEFQTLHRYTKSSFGFQWLRYRWGRNCFSKPVVAWAAT